jgi:hypothetical protein
VTSLLADRPGLFRDPPARLGRADAARRPSDCSGGGRLTLRARLDSVWEGLHADGAAECPACGGAMTLGGDPAAARCGGCGSQLS